MSTALIDDIERAFRSFQEAVAVLPKRPLDPQEVLFIATVGNLISPSPQPDPARIGRVLQVALAEALQIAPAHQDTWLLEWALDGDWLGRAQAIDRQIHQRQTQLLEQLLFPSLVPRSSVVRLKEILEKHQPNLLDPFALRSENLAFFYLCFFFVANPSDLVELMPTFALGVGLTLTEQTD